MRVVFCVQIHGFREDEHVLDAWQQLRTQLGHSRTLEFLISAKVYQRDYGGYQGLQMLFLRRTYAKSNVPILGPPISQTRKILATWTPSCYKKLRTLILTHNWRFQGYCPVVNSRNVISAVLHAVVGICPLKSV